MRPELILVFTLSDGKSTKFMRVSRNEYCELFYELKYHTDNQIERWAVLELKEHFPVWMRGDVHDLIDQLSLIIHDGSHDIVKVEISPLVETEYRI